MRPRWRGRRQREVLTHAQFLETTKKVIYGTVSLTGDEIKPGHHRGIRMRVREVGTSLCILEADSDMLYFIAALGAHGDDERFMDPLELDSPLCGNLKLEIAACWLPDDSEE